MKKGVIYFLFAYVSMFTAVEAQRCPYYDEERNNPYRDSNYFRDVNSIYYERDTYDLREDNSKYYRYLGNHNCHPQWCYRRIVKVICEE